MTPAIVVISYTIGVVAFFILSWELSSRSWKKKYILRAIKLYAHYRDNPSPGSVENMTSLKTIIDEQRSHLGLKPFTDEQYLTIGKYGKYS